MARHLYCYKALITRVIDGDTVEARIDLGFNILVNETFRIYGVDTPESFGKDKCEAGETAKKVVKEMLEGKEFEVNVFKKDKYGRWLLDILLPENHGTHFNTWLIKNNYAKEYFGGKKE